MTTLLRPKYILLVSFYLRVAVRLAVQPWWQVERRLTSPVNGRRRRPLVPLYLFLFICNMYVFPLTRKKCFN